MSADEKGMFRSIARAQCTNSDARGISELVGRETENSNSQSIYFITSKYKFSLGGRMPKSWTASLSLSALLFFLTFFAAFTSAQIPTKGNVFFGYSYDHTAISSGDSGSLNGWDAALEGKVAPWVGLVVDIDGHYGSRTYPVVCNGLTPCSGPFNANIAEHNFIFGPRVSVQVQRFRPFAEVLVGAAHVSRSNEISDSNTSFADAVGGGLDYRIAGPVAARAQLDWVNTRFYGQGQNGVRLNLGIAFHF